MNDYLVSEELLNMAEELEYPITMKEMIALLSEEIGAESDCD
jgi:hypothetical protein